MNNCPGFFHLLWYGIISGITNPYYIGITNPTKKDNFMVFCDKIIFLPKQEHHWGAGTKTLEYY